MPQVQIPHQDGILTAPVKTSKLTLDESFAEMALDRSDLKTARDWAETGIADGLEEDSDS